MADFSEVIDAQIRGATVRLTVLVELRFKSGIERLWQGAGRLQIDGQDWQGIGELAAMSPMQSGPRGAVEEIELSLFGDAGLLDNIESDADESVGREADIFLQFFDIRQTDDAGAWVDWKALDSKISLSWGIMGPMTVKRQVASDGKPGVRVASVLVQNALVNRQRPVFSFFSKEDQQARTGTTDDMFNMMQELVEGTVKWPIF